MRKPEPHCRAVGEYKEYRMINMRVSESWIRIIMCARIPDMNTKKEVPYYPEYGDAHLLSKTKFLNFFDDIGLRLS